MTTPAQTLPLLGGSKLQPRHLDRVALIYIRQSTLQQVTRHQESTRLQYALVERAAALGWSRDRIVVIDDDLGCSGTSTEGRLGFQRLVAEVSLDHVGLVLGLEMSRLARSCRDWHQLLEVCAVFGTLLGDTDGVYDPSNYNDRLLLGLKGTMSEAELHVIKQRLLHGKNAKAQRGDLGLLLPMGYVRRPSGEVIKDPDEQARGVIDLVFALFAKLATLHAVLAYLVKHAIKMPRRLSTGPGKGELEWVRPNRVTLSNLLHNPTYAGAYVYGRRRIDPRRQRPGRPSTGRTVTGPEQWAVLLKDRVPAYITWAEYERNQRQLRANTANAQGAIRQGPSLLSGILVCGHCGLKMSVQYSGPSNRTRYNCSRMMVDFGEPMCQSLAGSPLEALVTDLALQALAPAALEMSLQLAADVEAEQARLQQHWAQRLERARYTAERAARQYHAVDPDNRLVARTLEREWEESLRAEQTLKDDYDRFLRDQPQPLSKDDQFAIRAMAADLPSLWHAATTTPQDRQAILRHLIERVLVKVHGATEHVDVEIHWVGGHRTATTLQRPVARLEQLSYYPALCERIMALRADGLELATVAARLNAEGWRPAKRRATFTAAMVGEVLARLSPPPSRRASPPPDVVPRTEWTLSDLARELAMPSVSLYAWLRKGYLQATRAPDDPHHGWIIRADPAELTRLRALRTAPRTWPGHVRVD